MTRVLRHLVAIAALPFMVAVVVPRWLAASCGIVFAVPATLPAAGIVAAGVGVLLIGITLAAASVLRFAVDGHGTLAPWDPPKHFVATGPYRFMRNPMISGVILVLCGQAMILRSWVHAGWAGVFFLLNAMWIPLVEEPGLAARFGESYREYRRHVRRLFPRLSPYAGRSFSSGSGADLKIRPTHSGGVAAVVPAAGRSSRFGSDKRHAPIAGVPMIERVVARLEEAGVARVIVVDKESGGLQDQRALRPSDSGRRTCLTNHHPDRGMFSSIQIGLAEAVDAGVVLVQPADMPFVRADTIRVVIATCARTGRAVCPRHNGKRGHPLAFPSALVRALIDVDPATPLNTALAGLGIVRLELDVDDPGVLKDVDTEGDLT